MAPFAPKHSISQSAIQKSTEILAEIWKLLSFLEILHPILERDGRAYQYVRRRILYRKNKQNRYGWKRIYAKSLAESKRTDIFGSNRNKTQNSENSQRNSGWILGKWSSATTRLCF